MTFPTKTSARALLNMSMAFVTPISGLIHTPIWSQPDLVSVLAQATGSSSIAGVNHQIACAGLSCGMGTPPRSIPNFPTANSLATIDQMTAAQRSTNTGSSALPDYGVTRMTLRNVVGPIWEPENVQHIHDPDWRTRWVSVQRLAGSSSGPVFTGTKPSST